MAVRKYDLMVILDPARTEEQQKETLDKIDELIAKYGGTAEKREVLGKRRLAFLINKRREGYYAVIQFETLSTNEVLSEVNRFCKYSEQVLRHIITSAVVGKSTGNPALAEASMARNAASAGYGRGGYGRDRGPRRDDRGPAPVAAEAPAVEAPAGDAPEQPVVS